MKKLCLTMALVLIFSNLAGCKKEKPTPEPEMKETTTKALLLNTEDIKFLEDYEDSIEVAYTPKKIEAMVPEYTLKEDLSNVENIKSFGDFSKEQTKSLVEKGFFISPIPNTNDGDLETNTLKEQLFYIYEDNEYKNIPSFITTDSALHMYHLFYDNFLKELEENKLMPKLIELNNAMLVDSIAQYDALSNNAVKTLALKNTAFFATTQLLLEQPLPKNIPQEAAKLAKSEAEKINNTSGQHSDILNIPIDYTQFTVRGHYTKSDVLKKYFKTVMYFGQAAFFAKTDDEYRTDLTAQALLITDNIFKNQQSYKLWSDIYKPINFLVEGADDLGPNEFAKLLYGIYGKTPNLNELLDEDKINQVFSNMKAFPKAKIGYFLGYSFRFMPMRSVMDAALMQNLVDVMTPSSRPIYSGLDLMAVFGSEMARDFQLEDELNQSWPKYEKNLKDATNAVKLIEEKEWQKNLYRGWLWTLKDLTATFDKGYPKFMRSDSWTKKDLNTALGSWAELKHDTVLYGKQTMAEMGGGAYPNVPRSYVEPNIKVYEKLSWLIEYTQKNLAAREMLDERLESNLKNFKNMVDTLINASEKQLKNEELTEEEYLELNFIGGLMEHISLKFVNDESGYWSLINENDRAMAIVSDLMKVPENTLDLPINSFLTAAIGPAYEIYVVYPINGKLYIGRGGVFSYREFLSEERLTDEKWREQLKKTEDGAIPYWIKDEILEPKSQIPYPEMDY